jgi:hypothetical protein
MRPAAGAAQAETMTFPIPELDLAGLQLQAWHVALGLGLVCLALYSFARVQLERAKEDWANAFFYSPSTKSKHRQRRQRWQDRCYALLAGTALCLAVAAVLYAASLRQP